MERPNQLREVCQAGKLSEPAWYTVHRRVSIYLTWALLHTPLKPTHVTLLMMAAGVLGAALIAVPHLGVNLAGFAVLYLSFLLDKVDGEMARYLKVCSPRAVLLDRFHHLMIEPLTLVAAAWRAGGSADHGLVVVALATVILGNVLEEQPHLAPYALLKHLRENTQFPAARGVATQSPVNALYPIFRVLKAFRMFITVVPSLLFLYVAQAWTAAPLVRAYLYVALAAAVVYLAFQTVWYFDSKLENEIESMRDLIRADEPLFTGSAPDAASSAVSSSMAASARPMDDGRTVGPRTVSGAKRHEIPSRVVRDLV
jgi:phosphatidylglycerophosphate synthase